MIYFMHVSFFFIHPVYWHTSLPVELDRWSDVSSLIDLKATVLSSEMSQNRNTSIKAFIKPPLTLMWQFLTYLCMCMKSKRHYNYVNLHCYPLQNTYIHTYNIIYIAPFKPAYKVLKKKEGRERKIHRGKKGSKERKEANRLLWEQVGFDHLFERGYRGNASSHGRKFVP